MAESYLEGEMDEDNDNSMMQQLDENYQERSTVDLQQPASPIGSAAGSSRSASRSGSQSPQNDNRSRSPSVEGERSPASGSPRDDIRSPSPGSRSPRQGEQSPSADSRSPGNIRSPSPESRSPRHKAGSVSPNARSPADIHSPSPQSRSSGHRSVSSGREVRSQSRDKSPTGEIRSPGNSDSKLSGDKANVTSPLRSGSNSRLSANDNDDEAQGPSSPQIVTEQPQSPDSEGYSPPASPKDDEKDKINENETALGDGAGDSDADSDVVAPRKRGQQLKAHSGDESDKEGNESDKGANSDDEEPAQRRGSKSDEAEEQPDSDADSDDESPKKKKSRIKSAGKKSGNKSDDEDSDKGSEVGELIANIFGSSDEEEEFEGFGAAEVESTQHAVQEEKKEAESSDEEVEDKKPREDFVSDFDLMMAKKKEMSKKRRRRKDVDIINDNDDLVVEMIRKMREVAEDDRQCNQQRKPAVGKLKMLPTVLFELKKADLQIVLIENGILNAITDWLAPLPDKSLPHVSIRESMLKQLMEFPPIGAEALKASGIGKAVMYLYKHPKEERHNKDLAGKLINEWSRPIFNVTANHKSMSREEREQRDYEHLPKKRRLSLDGPGSKDVDRALAGGDTGPRPGEKGFIGRARVPQPSTKDYVVRPKWNVEEKVKGSGKKAMNRFEKKMRNLKEKQKDKSSHRAMPISISGNKMSV